VIDPSQLPFLSHEGRYETSLRTTGRLLSLRQRHSLNQSDYSYLLRQTAEWHSAFLQDVYLGALVNLASDEQLEKYEGLSRDMRIVGCYAQTELAHGSNVRGILTTATYLPEEDSFDLHTPSIEATKWWVGALGKSATHAIVFARLLVPSEGDLGMHAFMVPLRCPRTHQPLPGITVGDIGPKFGFAGVDNGFLRLNHVRVPRTELLSRFGSVLPGGKYQKPPHSKLGYAGMTSTRVNLAVRSGGQLAQAATIAIRYSIIRRQGGAGPDGREHQILNYTIQQHRLFTQLANAYALHFSGTYLTELMESYRKGVVSNAVDLDLLTELHIVSSGLKSTCSTIAAEGMEDCRKCCGGHGYSQFSGLPDMFASFVHICTAEGDNYVLTQQTTRFLLKCLSQVREGVFRSASPFTKYLSKSQAEVEAERCPVQRPEDFLSYKIQLAAFEHRASRAILTVAERLEAAVGRGLDADAAWNSVLVEVYRASFAHCLLLILSTFSQVVERNRTIPSIHVVLKRLCDLFALSQMEKDLSDLLEDGYLNRRQVGFLRDQARQLLTELRPDAVGLVDAWHFSDTVLNSAIGRRDGNVYETLFNWAQREPLNRSDVPQGVKDYLLPVISGDLSKL